MITSGTALVHWNYFVALTQDLEEISRYIEFHEDNHQTFSVELAHLLLSAASEVDVVLKLLCAHINPNGSPPNNINEYREIIQTGLPRMLAERIYISRYAMELDPWENWRTGTTTNPDWWSSYNKVKHERNAHFSKANLKNTLNAMAGLLVVIVHYYSKSFGIDQTEPPDSVLKKTTFRLDPEVKFIRLHEDHYYDSIAM